MRGWSRIAGTLLLALALAGCPRPMATVPDATREAAVPEVGALYQATLNIRLVSPRGVQTLPDSWDSAQVHVTNGRIKGEVLKTVATSASQFSCQVSVPPGVSTITVELFQGALKVATGQTGMTLTVGTNPVVLNLQTLTPFLNALTPSIGTGSQLVTLEGNLSSSSLTATFAGGPTAGTSPLGLNRATVNAPGATSGQVALSPDGVPNAWASYRDVSFGLGVGPFSAEFTQADSARASASLSLARVQPASVVVGPYLYVLGGQGAATAVDTVDQLTLNADGTVGNYSSGGGTHLQTACFGAKAVAIGHYVYVVGGNTGGAAIALVQRAAIGAGGVLGSFAGNPSGNMTAGRASPAVAVIGNYLYVFGGSDSSGAPLATYERAPINGDGSLGAFAAVAIFPNAREGAGVVVTQSSVFLVGGMSSGSPLNAIHRADVTGSGDIVNNWTTASSTVATARGFAGCVRLGDKVLLVGGQGSAGAALGTVEQASIDPSGQLSSFTTVSGTGLERARWGAAVAEGSNALVVVGGQDASGSKLDGVEVASYNASGNITAWSTEGYSLPSDRQGAASVVLGRNLYLIGGGGTPQTSTVYAQIQPDGSIQGFTNAGPSLTTARAYHSLAVIGNRLYVVGGLGASNYLKTIEWATINPDGTLSSFTTASAMLTDIQGRHTSAVLGNKLFIMGGFGTAGGTGIASVSACPITGVSLGMATVTGVLDQARYNAASFVASNSVYVVGGYVSSSPVPSVARAYPSGGGLGTFTGAGTLTTARYSHSVAVVGNVLYVVAGRGPSTFLNTTEKANINPTGLGTFVPVSGSSLINARGTHQSAVVGNYLFGFGGSDGSTLLSAERATLQ